MPKGLKQRRLHKAFLRYHDPANWPILRDALRRMGRADLIGNGKRHLVPSFQPKGFESAPSKRPFRTQHVRGNTEGSRDRVRRSKGPSRKRRGR